MTLAKTPDTNVASCEESVVLTFLPALSVPVRVTVGTRTFCRSDLIMLVTKSRITILLTFPCSP